MHAATPAPTRARPRSLTPLSVEKIALASFGPVERIAVVAVIRTPGPPSVTHALVLAPCARTTPAWTRTRERAFQAAIRQAAARWPGAIFEVYGARA